MIEIFACPRGRPFFRFSHCATSSCFPHMIVPLFVGREKSVRALEDVMKDDKQILLVTQKNAGQDDPSTDDIYSVGTIGTVLQLLKLPDGTVKVLVEGGQRARIAGFAAKSFFQAYAEIVRRTVGDERELEALARTVVVPVRAVHQAQQEDPAGSPGVDQSDRRAQQAGRHRGLAPLLKISEKQDLLETESVSRAAGKGLRLHGRARSASCRWRSASAAGSSGRWRRPSASTI